MVRFSQIFLNLHNNQIYLKDIDIFRR